MKRRDDGIFIAFEGIDGAGKTTQVAFLKDTLSSSGQNVVCSKEPTDGPWGRKIKQSASNGRMTFKEEIHAFTEDRKQHIRELVGPALKKKMTVILDRYFYSTIAYQGSHGGDVAKLDGLMHKIALEPDLVILLDVPPLVGLTRIKKSRGETPNAFESMENLTAVRKIFRKLARKHKNIKIIDGTMSPDEVRKAVMRRVKSALNRRSTVE
jgi:dTMP kinase